MTTLLKGKIVRNEAPEVQARFLCGCGLSRTFPFCDGSQSIRKSPKGGLVRCGAANGAEAVTGSARSG